MDNKLDKKLDELLIGIDNIRRSQLLHDQVKTLTIERFTISLVFKV